MTSYQETEVARGVRRRQRRVHAQLAVCLLRQPGRSGQGQVRRDGAPARGREPVGRNCRRLAAGISKFSKKIPVATEFVRYMTSPGAQKFMAIYSTNPPTIPAVAKDPSVGKRIRGSPRSRTSRE